MPRQQVERRLVGQLPGLEVHQRVEHGESRRILAEEAAEAGFPEFVAVPAIAADEDRDLAGLVGGGRDHRGRDPPDLEVVQADIGLPDALREIVEQREAGDAAVAQILDRLGDLVMGDGGRGKGIDPALHAAHQSGEIGRRLRRRERDHRLGPDVLRRGHGAPDLGREMLVEGLLFLVQHESEPHAGQFGLDALPDQARRVIADPLRRLEDLARRRLAHLLAPVEDAVDGGHADAGLARHIGDCLPACHRGPS